MKKGLLAAISTVAGAVAGGAVTGKYAAREIKNMKEKASNHFALFQVMDSWVQLYQEGKEIAEYFRKNNYKKIAVYGMSFVGERLYEELKDTDIEIVYIVDRNADNLYAEVDIYKPDDVLPKADAMVVTAVYYFDEIEEKMSEAVDCPVISLEDIIYDL